MNKKPILKATYYTISLYRRNKIVYTKEVSDFEAIVNTYNDLKPYSTKKDNYQIEFAHNVVGWDTKSVLATLEVEQIITAQEAIKRRSSTCNFT